MTRSVCFTVDNLGLAADIGRGLAHEPDPNEPGLAVGLPAILGVFATHGIAATVFAEGWNGVHHPSVIEALIEAGHEVGMHGWVHERWADLPRAHETELLERSLTALGDAGAKVAGFRAPGGERSAATLDLLSSMEMSYDASLDEAGARVDSTDIAVVPFRWEHVDWHWFGALPQPVDPSRFATALHAGLDEVDVDTPLVIVVHPRTTGLHAERLSVLSGFVERVAGDTAFDVVTMGVAASRLRGDQPA